MFVGGNRAPSPGLREFFLLTGKTACRRPQHLPPTILLRLLSTFKLPFCLARGEIHLPPWQLPLRKDEF